MRAGQFALLITALALAGCDRITGAANQRILDSEAIGYSCRVSLKPPEDCIKENDSMIPSSILDGWRVADKDIQAQLVDPSMGKKPSAAATAVSAPAAAKTGEAANAKPGEPGAAKPGKPAAAKTGEPAPAKKNTP